MPTFMPWEDKKASSWNTNQPLSLTSLTGYLLEPDVILDVHPSCTLGAYLCEYPVICRTPQLCPTKIRSPLSQHVRTHYSSDPLPPNTHSLMLSSVGKKSTRSCPAPHGKAGNLPDTTARRWHPHHHPGLQSLPIGEETASP